MKIKLLQEVDVERIEIELPVNYGDEDIPYDFPLRNGDMLYLEVDLETGKIESWPKNNPLSLYMKVVDGGSYHLTDYHGGYVQSIERNYVPHGVVPGEFGDYIDFEIDKNGVITNWPKPPSLDFSDFSE